MANVDLGQFRNLFIQTSLEYLQKLEDSMKILAKNPSDPVSIETMYISSHSLKSQSLLMGYTSLGNTAFSLEKLFRFAKEHVTPLPSQAITAVQLSLQAMRSTLNGIIKGDKEADLSEEAKRINLILEGMES